MQFSLKKHILLKIQMDWVRYRQSLCIHVHVNPLQNTKASSGLIKYL